MILMGDVNFDYQTCTNNKWHNLIQPSDLTQIVTEPTRITPSSSIIIDHIYTTQLVIISLSASQGKLVGRYKKNEHITTTYRSFKSFNEAQFLHDLVADIEPCINIMPNLRLVFSYQCV